MALLLERLKKPVGELLMHMGETYRKIQEERELLDRTLPTQPDGKVRTAFPGTLWEGSGQLGTKKIYPVQSTVRPSRSLLNSIIGPITDHSGTGQVSNSARGGHC